jgi:hypothetical protein
VKAIRRKPAPAHPPPRQRYFTDGVNLYQFITWLTRAGDSSLAAVEDCRSLELAIVSAEQLRAATLRRVRSSRA